jgi:hypothetical protein
MTEPNPIIEMIKALHAGDAAVVCEYCDADSELVEVEPNVVVLEIRHDDHCPELARREGWSAR